MFGQIGFGLQLGRLVPLGPTNIRGTQRQFLENICSEDDLRTRISVSYTHLTLPTSDLV